MKNLIKKILKEEIDLNFILNPEYYLDDFYSMDFNEDYDKNEAIQKIEKQIDYVKNIKYPIKVYRGIGVTTEYYEGASWTTDIKVAEGFGNKIFVGMIPNESVIDVEQTIRTRVMNPFEYEIYVPNANDIKIIDTYHLK